MVWRANQHYPGTIVPGFAGFRKQAEPNDSTSHSWYVCTTGTFVPLVRLYHTRTPRSSTTPQSKQTATNQRHQPTNTAPGPFTTPLPSLLCCSWCIYLPLRLLRVSRLLLGVCRCYTSVTRSLLVLASCWCLLFCTSGVPAKNWWCQCTGIRNLESLESLGLNPCSSDVSFSQSCLRELVRLYHWYVCTFGTIVPCR